MNISVQNVLDSLQSSKNVRYLGILAGAVVIGVAGWGGYYYFSMKKAQEAQKAFAESMAEYDKALQADSKDAHWDDVVRAFQTAYDRYSSTWAGPYILAYLSQALLQEGKPDEALNVMTKAVVSFNK